MLELSFDLEQSEEMRSALGVVGRMEEDHP